MEDGMGVRALLLQRDL